MQCFLRENDSFTVGSVQINVLKVHHDSVRLGITDPNSSPSYREELLYISDDDGGADEFDEQYEPMAIGDYSPLATSFL